MPDEDGQGMSRGTQLAIGILLLWFAGLCLFFAFLGGKTPALTSGRGSDGTPSGPRDMSGLVSRVAENIQAAEASGTAGGSEQFA